MSEIDRPSLFVHLLPTLIPAGVLRGGVAVVVDVLRATTAIVQALASGCSAVIPVAEVDEAKAVAAGFPAGSALLSGERQGLPIAGFDLGNSPGAFTPAVCRDKTLVMTTTNGTRAVLASLEAKRVFVAAFPNLLATAVRLRGLNEDVHVICSGTDGRVSLEDAVLAGALASDLSVPLGGRRQSWAFGNDEAEIVSRLWGGVSRSTTRASPSTSPAS
jgi:2-phosphosulfolactate phosphatase